MNMYNKFKINVKFVWTAVYGTVRAVVWKPGLEDWTWLSDHRGIKSRTRPMKGFKNIFCAQIFCTAFEEIRQFFQMKHKTRAEKRRLFSSRFQAFNQLAVKNV